MRQVFTPTVVVLTALEVEYAAVRALLNEPRIDIHPAGTRFEVGQLPGGRGAIALALSGPGNQAAAVVTERAIATFAPRALLFVGVAGGLHNDLEPGDVVVATKIYSHHSGKDEDGGFLARPQSWEVPHELDQVARHVARERAWLDLLRIGPERWPPPVYFRPIAAGEVVLNSRDTPLAVQMRTTYDDAAAIEMESAGTAKAGHFNRRQPVLTVRGISDKADGLKHASDAAGWQAVASANAAAFAVVLAGEILESSGTGQVGSSHPGRVTWPCRAGTVPLRSDKFQDRDLARVLADTAHTSDGPARTTVLSGLGGVGKTQLAADYAERTWTDRNVDLLVWITAVSREAIVTAYARLATDLTGIDDPDPAQGANRLLTWLATTDKRWLLVLDDLQNPVDLQGLWPPHADAGNVVVTTRRRDAALKGFRRRLIDIDLFTSTESHTYLSSKLADHPYLADDVDGLANDLGHLPLALAQAAAYLLDRQIPCAEYRRRLAQRKLETVLPAQHNLPDDHRTTVAATWALSIKHADSLEPVGLAGPLLQLASVLDPNGIPGGLFTAPAVMDFLAEPTGAEVNPDDARDALTCLHRLSLLTVNPRSTYQTVRIHALVQRANRDHQPPRRIARITQAAADALLQIWPPPFTSDTVQSQVLRSNTAALQTAGSDEPLWRDGECHELLFRMGASFGESGLVNAAVTHYEQLSSMAGDRLGPENPDTFAARHNLAIWCGEAGDPLGAVTALETLLKDQQRVLGPDDPGALSARRNLARFRGETGDMAGAVAALEEVLADQQRVLGPDHPDTLRARRNLARFRGEAGDMAGAVAALEEVLADQQRVLGPDHPDTLRTRHNLARFRGETGDMAGAVAALEEVLADQQRVLGPDHPDTLRTRHNLAEVNHEAVGTTATVAALEEVLADQQRVLGHDHPDTRRIRESLKWRRGRSGK